MDRKKLRGIVQQVRDGGVPSHAQAITDLQEMGVRVHPIMGLSATEAYASQVLLALLRGETGLVRELASVVDGWVPAEVPEMDGAA